jgi:hypothetical protein
VYALPNIPDGSGTVVPIQLPSNYTSPSPTSYTMTAGKTITYSVVVTCTP